MPTRIDLKPTLTNILAILLSGERRRFFVVTTCNILISILDIAALAALLIIVNLFTSDSISTAKFHFLPAAIQTNERLWLIGGFLLFFAIKNGCAYLVHQAQYRFVYQVASRISGMQMLRYLEGSMAAHTETDSSVWIQQISQQPIEFSHYILAGVQQMITETVLIGLSVIAILLFNAKVFLLLLLVLTPAIGLVSFFIRARLQKTRRMIKTGGERSLQHLQEALDGYVESNLYHKNAFFSERYSRYQQELNADLSQLQSIQGAPSRMMEVFAVAGLFVLVLIHSLYDGGRGIDILTIGAFVGAAYKIIPGMVKLLNINSQIKTFSFTLTTLMGKENNREDPEASTVGIPVRSVEFSSVNFDYHGKRVLTDLSFSIRSGELVGISGDSGKGKTTLINLLLGFLSQGAGTIQFNGTETTARQRKQFWNGIAYVKQQPFIIHDSILANITMENEQYDEQRLNDAIVDAGLSEFVGSFPEGIQKVIGEQGRTISGGQRQRIAIARALYKKASLLLFDEPFNELDKESELTLLHHLQQLASSGKTVLLITHNRESLAFCTKIISVDEQA